MSEKYTKAAFESHIGEGRIMGSRCQDCGALHLPPRALCRACFGGELAWEEIGGDGKLAAFTAVHIAPTAMIEAGYGRKNPYCVGIVDLVAGPSISAQIVGVDPERPEEIAIGTPVQAIFLTHGEGEDKLVSLAFQVDGG
jgi:uncharacterized OB-fold protein